MMPSDIEVAYELGPDRLPQLMDLYAGEWWTARRATTDVARMLAGSDIVVALIHRPSDRMVGFARVLTDGAYVGVILDVIVAAEWRRSGLGSTLMEAIVGHPRLAAVDSLELVCQPGLMAFYRRFGFTEQVGGSRLMRRTSDPALLGPLVP
jgi:GNAT superfamily N-acetyltransferase